jgi:MFS transporter, putative metabolite transport protein
VGAAIGTSTTLWALSNLGISGTMWISAGIAGVGVLVSYVTAPATRGKSLHEAVWL